MMAGAAQQQQLNGMNPNQQQSRMNPAQAYYTKMYQEQLRRLRNEMAQRHGPPSNYSEQARKEFMETTDQQAKQFVSEMMRRDRDSGNPRALEFAQVQANQAAQAQARAQAQAQAQARHQAQHQAQQQAQQGQPPQGMMGK